MAEDSNYRVKKQRRRNQETDYQKRLKLLKSGKPRAVVRLSNKHTRVQIAEFDPEGDQNSAQTSSEELEEFGWDENTSNLPAAYLTGFLAGTKADVDEAILDPGIRTVKKGGRMFAAIEGLRDAGVEVPVGESALPDESRIRGEHIEEMHDSEITDTFEKVREEIEGENQ